MPTVSENAKLLKSESLQEQRKHAQAFPGLNMYCNFLKLGLSATPRSYIFLAQVELIIDLSVKRSLFAVAVLLGNKRSFWWIKKALKWKWQVQVSQLII